MPSIRKQAIALVIRNHLDPGQVLVVRRPDDPDEEFSGMWGLPAGLQRPGESRWETALRIAQDKLGLDLRLGGETAHGQQARKDHTLAMALMEAEIAAGEPLLPDIAGRRGGSTYYTAWKWAAPGVLRESAEKGSLCSQLLLGVLKRGHARS
ncbi:MAG: NUDIX domain-containing protein [Chloroflexi bacterium]|nr:NUDIX domain-containing protein [Chloroflexota bacterium]